VKYDSKLGAHKFPNGFRAKNFWHLAKTCVRAEIRKLNLSGYTGTGDVSRETI